MKDYTFQRGSTIIHVLATSDGDAVRIYNQMTGEDLFMVEVKGIDLEKAKKTKNHMFLNRRLVHVLPIIPKVGDWIYAFSNEKEQFEVLEIVDKNAEKELFTRIHPQFIFLLEPLA